MKMKLLSLVAAFGLCVPMVARDYMCVKQNDGTVVKYNIDDVKKVYYNIEIFYQVDGHEYVDLGLPSGLKWATMNVGAKKVGALGRYYAWGEIRTDTYSSAAYKTVSELEASGVIDANGNLTAEYDAATQNWGENWRMPTREEWKELQDYCTWTWTELGDVKGYKVASKATGNSNWIFFPRDYNIADRNICHFWTSTVHPKVTSDSYSYSFHLEMVNPHVNGIASRSGGLSVRPVVKE